MLITSDLGWDKEGLYLLFRWSGSKDRVFASLTREEQELLEEPYASKIALIEKFHGLPKNHIINEYRKLSRDSIK